MQKYFESNYCDIMWDETNKIVHSKWKGSATSDEIRKVMDDTLSFLAEKKAYKAISDRSFVPLMDQADTDWINNNWFPRAIIAGMRKLAVVLPTSIITKMQVRRIMNIEAMSNFECYECSSAEEGIAWLCAQ